ncbi:hypothetical protein ABK040_008452 [Willaertia magna]
MHLKTLCISLILISIITLGVALNLKPKKNNNKGTTTHIIPVPYYDQITGYSCGDGSLNMVLGYYNEQQKLKQPFDQRAIIDVARTSNHTGTYSLDVVRTARFSPLSSTPSVPNQQFYIQYPQQAPSNGWFGNPSNSSSLIPVNLFQHVGLLTAHFPERNSMSPCSKRDNGDSYCWTDILVNQFLKNNIPVICLMNFRIDSGGHFRVAVGYESDENDKVTRIIMLDPYDRNGNPTTANYTVDEFCQYWQHYEPYDDTNCFKPYFGVAVYPLSIDVVEKVTTSLSFTIRVNNPCVFPPSKSNNLLTNLLNVMVEIHVLGEENVKTGESPILKIVSLPLSNSLPSCKTEMVNWGLPMDLIDDAKYIKVIAKGLVCDKVGAAQYNGNNFSPAYSYCDYVGGVVLHELDN